MLIQPDKYRANDNSFTLALALLVAWGYFVLFYMGCIHRILAIIWLAAGTFITLSVIEWCRAFRYEQPKFSVIDRI